MTQETITLFVADDTSPITKLNKLGHCFGYKNSEMALLFRLKLGYPSIWMFKAREYQIERKKYMKEWNYGKEICDDEYIVYEIQMEKKLV